MWSIAACRTFISGLWWCEQRRLDSIPGVLPPRFKDSSTDKESQRKQKSKIKKKTTNKNLRPGTNWDKLMSVTMNVLFYSFLSGAPRGTSERRLCSRAGLLLFNSSLLKVYYVPGTVPRIWVQWWTEKSKISLEVAWHNHAKGRVTWTQGLNSGSGEA